MILKRKEQANIENDHTYFYILYKNLPRLNRENTIQ